MDNNGNAYPTGDMNQPEIPGQGGFAPGQQSGFGVPAEAQELGYVNIAYIQGQPLSSGSSDRVASLQEKPQASSPSWQPQAQEWQQPQDWLPQAQFDEFPQMQPQIGELPQSQPQAQDWQQPQDWQQSQAQLPQQMQPQPWQQQPHQATPLQMQQPQAQQTQMQQSQQLQPGILPQGQQPQPQQSQAQQPQPWQQPTQQQQQPQQPQQHPQPWQQPQSWQQTRPYGQTPPAPAPRQPYMQGMPQAARSFASPMVLLDAEEPRTEEDALELHDGAAAKRKPRKGPWTVVFFIALAVFLASMGALAYIFYTYQAGEQSYDELDKFVAMPVSQDATDDLYSFDIDWEGLKEINPDVVGWVYLPGTIINYPVVYQADGGQEYYMTHNFQRHSFEGFGAEYGCPVLADVNSPEWNDKISFIAGHHMWNDTMFSFLESMVDTDVFNENRTFYLLTPKGNFRLNAIACNRISQYSKETVIPNFGTTKEFREYMQNAYDTSLVEPNPAPPAVNSLKQIVALYTCSNVNDTFRIMIYCDVEQFLPAGSKVPKDNALMDDSTSEEIQSSVEERVQ